MNVLLWTLQVLLAAVFLWHGVFMVAPPAAMVEMINAQLGIALRLFIGSAEVLAAAGLILPGVTRLLPMLTPLAAAGLTVLMAGATVLHLAHGEVSSAVTTAVLLVLVTFVTVMRWKHLPLTPRRIAHILPATD